MKNTSLTLLLLIPALAFSQTMHYSGMNVTADYTTKDGMLSGKYISRYKNGKKKAEGTFENNCRFGKWYAYDSTGTLKAEREYSNPMEYRQTLPAISDSLRRISNMHKYKPMRNADGYYTYSFLHQKAIIWSKRIWSYIYNGDNPTISKNNAMFNALYAQILNHHIVAYKRKNIQETFGDSVDFSATPLDTSNIQILGFTSFEDWYYDSETNEMGCRTIGICPLAKMKEHDYNTVNTKFISSNVKDGNKDTVGLFWIYFPQVRKYLAQEKVTSIIGYPHIQNMDDIFFWKCYNERILWENGVNNLWTEQPSPVADTWSTIMQMIDLEHEIWMGTAKAVKNPFED
jgi:hypothetical protein